MNAGESVAHMAGMGLLVAVAAPLLLRAALCVAPELDRAAPPAVVALPGFVVLHALVTLDGDRLGPLGPALLLLGAAAFWAPVFGVHRRLPDGGRVLYLFLAMPMLDLAGVWTVAAGDGLGGLAMIVGMLPMGAFAMVVFWRWVTAEERRAELADATAEVWEGRT